MSLTNEQLQKYFSDEFTGLKIRLAVNEDKSNEILRELSVITQETKDIKSTLYGKGGMLEEFIIMKTEHTQNKEGNTPGVVIAKKTLRKENAALWVSTGAILIAVFKDVLLKYV